MRVKTAKGKVFECEAVTSIPMPPRLYFHLVNTSVEEVEETFSDISQLPIDGYAPFNAVQSISPEGAASVKVSLKIEGF